MTSIREVRRDLEAAMAEGGHLGDLVNWTIRVGDGVLPGEVEQALLEHGLSTDPMPSEPSPYSAARRVMREYKRLGLVFRKIASDDAHVRYAVANTAIDSDAKVGDRAGEVINTMAYLKPEGMEEIVFEDEEEPFGQEMVARFARYRGRLDRDAVRNMIKAFLVVEFGGVKVSSGLGLCFVPTEHVDSVRRLEQAVAKLGESELGVLPVPGTPAAKRTVGNSVREAVEHRIAKFRAELDGWDNDVRPTTVERRLEKYRDLRRQAEDLRNFLGQANADLLSGIDGLSRSARALLEANVDPDAPAEPETKPETKKGPDKKAAPKKPAKPAEPSIDPTDGNGLPMYSAMRIADLKRTCKAHGIDAKGMKKNDMVEALESL